MKHTLIITPEADILVANTRKGIETAAEAASTLEGGIPNTRKGIETGNQRRPEGGEGLLLIPVRELKPIEVPLWDVEGVDVVANTRKGIETRSS